MTKQNNNNSSSQPNNKQTWWWIDTSNTDRFGEWGSRQVDGNTVVEMNIMLFRERTYP